MSFLFIVDKQVVKPNVETLLLSPFKEIWERDLTPGKFVAIDELTFIEFMSSVKKSNPYRGYDIPERKKRLAKDIMKQEGYIPDDLMRDGIDFLLEHQKTSSTTYSYYLSARAAAEKLQHFFNTFDMNSVNIKTGAPIYKPKEITTSLIDTARVVENLDALEEKVINEIYETAKNKGQKTVSIFANPDTL